MAPHPALRVSLAAPFSHPLQSRPAARTVSALIALPFPSRLVASAYHTRFSQAAEVGILIPFLE